MRKREFLYELERNLQGVDKSEIDSLAQFYSEMIDDRVDKGNLEEDVILSLDSPQEIARNFLAANPNNITNRNRQSNEYVRYNEYGSGQSGGYTEKPYVNNSYTEPPRASRAQDNNAAPQQCCAPQKEKKAYPNILNIGWWLSSWWRIIIFAILICPLLIGFGSAAMGLIIGALAIFFSLYIVAVSLIISAGAMIISGVAAFIYSIAQSAAIGSPMLFFLQGGASLLVFGLGLIFIYFTFKLLKAVHFMYLKVFVRAKKKINEKREVQVNENK